MPIIEFICPKCKEKTEKILSFAELEVLDKNLPVCEDDEVEMQRVEFSTNTFRLIGAFH
jgi:hypothetical protein